MIESGRIKVFLKQPLQRHMRLAWRLQSTDRNRVSLQWMNRLVDTELMSQSRYLVRPADFANKRVTMRAYRDREHMPRAATKAKVSDCVSMTAIELPPQQVVKLVEIQLVL
jgi:hypothetical protein